MSFFDWTPLWRAARLERNGRERARPGMSNFDHISPHRRPQRLVLVVPGGRSLVLAPRDPRRAERTVMVLGDDGDARA